MTTAKGIGLNRNKYLCVFAGIIDATGSNFVEFCGLLKPEKVDGVVMTSRTNPWILLNQMILKKLGFIKKGG